jgi:hypothetical protein
VLHPDAVVDVLELRRLYFVCVRCKYIYRAFGRNDKTVTVSGQILQSLAVVLVGLIENRVQVNERCQPFFL